ncbi:peptidase S8 and S53 subtilisin kexin sedolisin [gamma proteobacterium HdN1]|nr:peptidase S8 and S53 subtilisin kexin sedolisin [gamma proteobacterium HdN1]
MDLRYPILAGMISTLLLAGCGGGGGGGGKGGEAPDRGTGGSKDAWSISGKISAAYGIEADWDTNDPTSGNRSNDSTPQRINSVTTVHGFASAVPTGDTSGRFSQTPDKQDFFEVDLRRGQLIQLQVADWNHELPARKGDLDLVLLEVKGGNAEVVAASQLETEFEQISAPRDGKYIVMVGAASGMSKYVLQITGVNGKAVQNTQGMDFVPGEMIVKYRDRTPLASARLKTQSGESTLLSLSHQDSSRPVLAKLGQPKRLARSLLNVSSKEAGFLEEWQKNNPENYQKFLTLLAIKEMRNNPDVETVDPNYIREAMAIPNDEFYSYQWHYPQIKLPQAWDLTTGKRNGKPVIVAVIDSGVVQEHEDLKNQLVPGFDFATEGSEPGDSDGLDDNPDDSCGEAWGYHGTHVAGTIAAETNNGTGVAGVAWGAKIMPLRVLGCLGGSDYSTMQALRFAAGLPNDSGRVPAQKADVANLSLGGFGPNATFENEIPRLRAAGLILVGSSGNNAQNPEKCQVCYPASYNGFVSVGAVDMNKERSYYSTYNEFVDIAAPGGDASVDKNGDRFPDGVLSTVINEQGGRRLQDYAFYQGTSMAAPHVSGVFALMRAVNPGLTPDQVDAVIANGSIVDDLGPRGRDDEYGHGLINALKAVQVAQQLAAGGGNNPAPGNAAIVSNVSTIAFGSETNSARFTLSKQGQAALKLGRIEVDAPWLSVQANKVDANGFGEYTASVSRANLNPGQYGAKISLTDSNGARSSIAVTLQVGSLSNESTGLATPWVFLLDADRDMDLVTYTDGKSVNGTWQYKLENIPNGQYFVLASSDVDFDDSYCDDGETCGSYPSFGNAQVIKVEGRDVTNANILLELPSFLGINSASMNSAAEGYSAAEESSAVDHVDVENLKRRMNQLRVRADAPQTAQ